MGPSETKITSQDVYKKFCEYFGSSLATDYRPFDSDFAEGMVWITVWLKNGDLVFLFHKGELRTNGSIFKQYSRHR